MNGEQYLIDSEKTLAPQDEEQRAVPNEFYEDALDLAYAGNVCDRIKRTIFYKDYNADERFSKQAGDISRIVHNVPASGSEARVLTQWETDMLHAALGTGSEAGEIMEAVITGILGGTTDQVNMKEEVGDVLWYLAIICRRCNFTLEEAMQANIDKLAKRYPNKFNTEDAVKRDVDSERKILEG